MDKKRDESVSTWVRIRHHLLKTVFSAAVLVGAVAIAVALYLMRTPPESRTPDQLVPLVRVATAAPYTGTLTLSLSGTVVPHREVRIAAEVSGRVIEKTPQCRAGSHVSAGDLLIVIDRENYELALRTAEAELEQSRIMVTETDQELQWLRENVRLAEEQVQLLEEEFRRNERLGTVVTRSELDQSKRALLDARAQLATRENALSTTLTRVERMNAARVLAERRVERARLDLSRTEIRAPFDGVIARDLVEKDDFVQMGTLLLQVEDTQRVDVLCNLTDTELRWIRRHAPAAMPGQTSMETGQRAAYLLPPLPVLIQDPREAETTWAGRLDRFDGIGRDELTKATPVRIVVEQPVVDVPGVGPRALVRGSFVKCRLEVEGRPSVDSPELVSLPLLAIRPGGFVWVLQGDQVFRKAARRVDEASAGLPGEVGTGAMAICQVQPEGVRPGDLVVVSPLSQPTDGMRVARDPADVVSSAGEQLPERASPADRSDAPEAPLAGGDS